MTIAAQLEALGHPVAWANSLGLYPVYFTETTKKDYFTNNIEEFTKISREVWGMMNYAGMLTPWHDTGRPIWDGQKKSLNTFFHNLEEAGVSWQLYCYLIFITMEWNKWDSPCTLIGGRPELSWVRKLYEEFGEYTVSQTVMALYKFFELQYQYYGELNFERKNLIRKDTRSGKSGKCLEAIHKLGRRVIQIHNLGIPFSVWLEDKMEAFHKYQPKAIPNLATMVNHNGLDPNVEEIKERLADPWTEIKDFLGLPSDCLFADGSIPKGWQPIIEEYIDPKRIKKINKDGHYLIDDGSQRRGKYHYIKNTYLCISCTPENFSRFKSTWKDPRLYVSTPTWEEYSQWALNPGLWDAEGNATNERSKPVKWRTK